MKQIAIDGGFLYLKVATGPTSDACQTVPNAIGAVNEHVTGILPDFRFEEATGLPLSFSTGPYAVEYGGIPSNNQDRLWYLSSAIKPTLSQDFRKMLYTAFALARVQDGDDLELRLCIPLGERKHALTIKNLLFGEHMYKLYGEEQVICNVKQVRIRYQGVYAFIHWCQTQNIDPNTINAYLVDIGGNTMHEAMFRHGIDVTEGTKPHYEHGSWQIIQAVQTHCSQELGYDMNPIQAARITRARKVYIKGWIDLTDLIETEIERVAHIHIRHISHHAEMLKGYEYMLLSGGNACDFLKYYQRLDERFQLVPNAFWANVLGTWR